MAIITRIAETWHDRREYIWVEWEDANYPAESFEARSSWHDEDVDEALASIGEDAIERDTFVGVGERFAAHWPEKVKPFLAQYGMSAWELRAERQQKGGE